MSNEEQRQIRIDTQIPLHVSEFISTALKDECTRLHECAAKMNQEDGKPLRDQAHEFNAWSDKFRFAHPRPRPQIEHRWEGASVDQRHASGNSSIVQMESSKILPWAMFMSLLSGVAIGMALLAMRDANLAERETKLLREDVRVMSIALAKHGIDTDEHSTEQEK